MQLPFSGFIACIDTYRAHRPVTTHRKRNTDYPEIQPNTEHDGKYQARRHRATFSNRAPWASAHSWIGVVRIGSNRAWRAGPTSAPKVTGV